MKNKFILLCIVASLVGCGKSDDGKDNTKKISQSGDSSQSENQPVQSENQPVQSENQPVQSGDETEQTDVVTEKQPVVVTEKQPVVETEQTDVVTEEQPVVETEQTDVVTLPQQPSVDINELPSETEQTELPADEVNQDQGLIATGADLKNGQGKLPALNENYATMTSAPEDISWPGSEITLKSFGIDIYYTNCEMNQDGELTSCDRANESNKLQLNFAGSKVQEALNRQNSSLRPTINLNANTFSSLVTGNNGKVRNGTLPTTYFNLDSAKGGAYESPFSTQFQSILSSAASETYGSVLNRMDFKEILKLSSEDENVAYKLPPSIFKATIFTASEYGAPLSSSLLKNRSIRDGYYNQFAFFVLPKEGEYSVKVPIRFEFKFGFEDYDLSYITSDYRYLKGMAYAQTDLWKFQNTKDSSQKLLLAGDTIDNFSKNKTIKPLTSDNGATWAKLYNQKRLLTINEKNVLKEFTGKKPRRYEVNGQVVSRSVIAKDFGDTLSQPLNVADVRKLFKAAAGRYYQVAPKKGYKSVGDDCGEPCTIKYDFGKGLSIERSIKNGIEYFTFNTNGKPVKLTYMSETAFK